jgi:hypothetical protein
LKTPKGQSERGKQKWTIERNWQHRVQEDEEKHKKHNTIYVGHHYIRL